MHEVIVIYVLFLASFSQIWAPVAGTKRKSPYVLAEYEDSKRIRHFEFPSCAFRDETKNEIIFSSPDKKFEALYLCYPIFLDDCAMDLGIYLNGYCAFKKPPECGVAGNYQYAIEPVPDSLQAEEACAHIQENAQLYQVGYNFRFFAGEVVKNEIYRFCYDKTNKKTLYAEYKIILPDLLSNSDVNDEKSHGEVNTLSFGREEFEGFGKKKDFFKKMAAEPNNDLAARRLVVPPSHMALDWRKEALFHIVNQELLKPKFHDAMDSINDYIAEEAAERLGEVFVRTGVMDTSEDVYDASVWWKLIYDQTREYAIAVIIHNSAASVIKKLCGDPNENFCAEYGWDKILENDVKEFVYCCDPNFLTFLFEYTPVKTLNLKTYSGEKKNCKILPKSARRPNLDGDFSATNANMVEVN